jgi:hypothetical protein
MDVTHRINGVVDSRGERILRSQSVVDREKTHPGVGRESSTQRIVGVKVAHDESPAVKVQDQGLALVVDGDVQAGAQRSTNEGQRHVTYGLHPFHLAAIGE